MRLIKKISYCVIFLCIMLRSAFVMSAVSKSPLLFLWMDASDKLTLKIVSNSDFDETKLNIHALSPIKISEVSKRQDEIVIKLNRQIGLGKDLYLTYDKQKIYAYPRYQYLNLSYAPIEKRLGLSQQEGHYRYNVWSPTATKVQLIILKNDEKIIRRLKLTDKGIWITDALKPSDMNRPAYLEVSAFGQTFKGVDPYARALSASNPRSQLEANGVLLSLPTPKRYKGIKNMANAVDFIAMEIHTRDFTIDKSSTVAAELAGTFVGLKQKLGHFKNLGVTHLQLMPIQNFYSVNEFDRSYQGDKIKSSAINYNWGYDPQHYFALENWYFTQPTNVQKGMKEFKSMVAQIHKLGMGVIIDVVYNHLYDQNTLENTAPGCYMRRGDKGKISFASGAGASLESRNLMTRKLMIDSLVFYRDEYKIDGFRFDLMGFTDVDTMREIRRVLGDDIILYGEAWEFTDLPPSQATTKSNLPVGTNISAFNDTGRDSYTGNMMEKGFVQGAFYHVPKLKAALIAGLKDFPDLDISQDQYHRFATSPVDTLNYLTIHDGHTLWDKLNLSYLGSVTDRIQLQKFALGLLLTSQGRIILHGGVDMARSKPLSKNDPNPHRAETSEKVNAENGIKYFHENTYKSPDTTNAIAWDRAETFSSINRYAKGLIQLRRSTPALRYFKAASVQKGLEFQHLYPSLAHKNKEFEKQNKNHAIFDNFNDPKLESLQVEFINAPISAYNQQYFFSGEVHSQKNKNPLKNKFSVKFDGNGTAQYKFTKKEMAQFDLQSWSDPLGLQIKLIKNPGEWDSLDGAYSPTGNNTINPQSIDTHFKTVIDLSIINHTAGNIRVENKGILVFSLDNTLEDATFKKYKKLPYQKILVLYNATSKQQQISNLFVLADFKYKDILVDDQTAGILPLQKSSVRIGKTYITIPAKSMAVIGLNN